MSTGPVGTGPWRKVTRASPCPVCGKPDWCAVAPSGQVVRCQRQWQGAYAERIDRAGIAYYLHHIGEPGQPLPLPPPPDSAPSRAEAGVLDAVYTAWLGRLTLSISHRENLRRRGLDDDAIDLNNYRSLPIQGRARLAGELRDRFGDAVLQVPGLVQRQGERGPYLSLAGPAGLVVPVRDMAGRTVALKVRLDEPGDGPKYLYISSTRHGGPGPGSPVHVPLGVTPPCQRVRITEGEIKADIAYHLTGVPTISIPGATVWRPALPVLQHLHARTVVLAWDQDWQTNPDVARGLAGCGRALLHTGRRVEIETWGAKP